MLLSNIGRDGDSADSPGGSNPPVAAPSPPAAGVQTVAPVEVPPPGTWWLPDYDGTGDGTHLMIPEPVPFLDLIRHARQLRVLTAEGLDATFEVTGFLTTPVQANLDHCGHYP
ncbi:MAG: hypothetical protein OXG52_12935 [bacterium]|nr:hypothetical protein [bacterium]